MLIRITLIIIFLNIGFQFANAKNNLGVHESFKNQDLENQYQLIVSKLSKFDTIKIKSNNDYLFNESIKTSNDYYTNLALANYIDYYFYQGDFRTIINLYQENINYPKSKHLLSYIQLLSKFYIFFYNYGINYECKYILSQLKILKDQLPKEEQLYAKAIINIYDGMIEEGVNKFDLKKSLLLEAINIIEFYKDRLPNSEYKIRLSSAYNHLAISYANNVQLINDNKNNVNVNEIEHAASLLRKAIRINADYSYINSAIFKSNLAFINNILMKSEDAIYYGNRSIFYISKIKNSEIILRKSACNVADTYLLNEMTNSFAYQEAKEMCTYNIDLYNKDKRLVVELSKKIKRPEIIPLEKESFISQNIIYIISGIFILIFTSLFILKFNNNSKTS